MSPDPIEKLSAEGVQELALTQAIDSYQRYYASGESHTARAKRLDLKKFVNFLTRRNAVSSADKLTVADWDHSTVQHFVDELLGRGESPATVARRLATIKHMGRTLSEKIPGFKNPAREVKSPRSKPPRPKGLSPKEVEAIKKLARERITEKTSFIRVRNRALFLFLIDTGLRAEEVRLLRMNQLDSDLEWIKNVRTKGRRYRNVYVTSEMRPVLEEYFARRFKELERFFPKLTVKQNNQLPVFLSTYRADAADPDSWLMGAKSIWRAINELSTETNLHPHLLRHSYALDLLDTSKDIRLVSQALGHSDVRVTMRYTERDDEELAKALEENRRAKKAS